jgi:hypothetical protein
MKFMWVIQLKTVQALGITMPKSPHPGGRDERWGTKSGPRSDARFVGNLEAYNGCTNARRNDRTPNVASDDLHQPQEPHAQSIGKVTR